MIRLQQPSVWTVIALGALLILTFTILYPLSSLFAASVTDPQTGGFSLAGYTAFFSTPDFVAALFNTLLLGLITTLGALALGVGSAFVVARFDFPLKPLVGMLPLVTLVIPDVIVVQSWIMVFGNNGIVTNFFWDMFRVNTPRFYGWTGLIFVMILQHYAYIYLTVFAAFKSIDGTLEEAAQNLGSSPQRTYWTVTIPVLTPSVLVSAMVVFSMSIDNFGIPAIVAPRVPILSVMAYNTFISELGSDPVMQSTMSVMLVVIAAVVLIVQKLYVERRVYQMEAGRAPDIKDLTGLRGRLVSGAVTGFVLLSLLPVMIILAAAVTHSKGPVLHWGVLSIENLRRAVIFTPEALYNSFFLASIATIMGTVFAIFVSYMLIKKRSLLTNILDFAAVLPLVVAGTVLGIAPDRRLQHRYGRADRHLGHYGYGLFRAPSAVRHSNDVGPDPRHSGIDRRGFGQPWCVTGPELCEGGSADHEARHHQRRDLHVGHHSFGTERHDCALFRRSDDNADPDLSTT